MSMIGQPPAGFPPFLKQWLDQAYVLLFSVQQSGTTAQRPTAQLYIGRFYFDTTLTMPIWIKSVSAGVATWCRYDGTAV